MSFAKRERRMRIVTSDGSRSKERTPSGVAEVRAAKPGERSGVPWYESLLLTGLLLVVIGWIILRLLRILLAAS
jgi:hypothetical protein